MTEQRPATKSCGLTLLAASIAALMTLSACAPTPRVADRTNEPRAATAERAAPEDLAPFRRRAPDQDPLAALDPPAAPLDAAAIVGGEIAAEPVAVVPAAAPITDAAVVDLVTEAPEPAPYVPAIPMEANPLVERTLNEFLEHRQRLLGIWVSRARTWFPMIEQIFAEEGVPDELKYLALTESALDPVAISRVGAAGMWQFMPSTATDMGLDIDRWVDERRDPELATRAAAKHLLYLHELYDGNWLLALAGYNCSPRCITRAIERAGSSTEDPRSFWKIYPFLPHETREFVPRFIAAALLVSDPERFGITVDELGEDYRYDVVEITGALKLDLVAQLVGTDLETLRRLNPALRREYSPNRENPYALRIPAGTQEHLVAGLSALPVEDLVAPAEYIVQPGDTLDAIARRHSVALSELTAANGIRGHLIHPGQRLLLPGAGPNNEVTIVDSRTAVSFTQAGPRVIPLPEDFALVEKVGPRGALLAVELLERERFADLFSPVVYAVKRGDTLSQIADSFRVSVSQIRLWNGIPGSTIYPGQELIVHAVDASAVTQSYRVQRGDNLSAIARRFGVSVDALQRRNNLAGNLIHPGQELFVPN